MKKIILTLCVTALFSLLGTTAFTGTTPQQIDPYAPKYDLGIKKGMVDYTGSGTDQKKIIEFIIRNNMINPTPKTTVVFKRGKQTSIAKIPSLKGGKKVKVRFVCNYSHGAMDFSAVISLKDANPKNNIVKGME